MRKATEYRDGLTYKSAKEKYPWLFRAETENVVIGENLDGLVWYEGTWVNGVWKSGTWLDGWWIDGTWKGGEWLSGTWLRGIWLAGKWHGGVWRGGLCWSGTALVAGPPAQAEEVRP